MTRIHIKITKALRKLARANVEAQRALQKGIVKAGFFVESEVKASISGHRAEPASVDFGLFRASVHTIIGPGSASVRSGVPYAKYLEYGTSPHFVKPTTADALHWTITGKDFFSKGHMVAGIRPRRHFRNTAIRARKHVIRIIENEVRHAVRREGLK